MKNWEFKVGHEDAQIPYPYIKGGVVTIENCTDEIVDIIKAKFPHLGHNFVEAGTQEVIEVEAKSGANEGLKVDSKVEITDLEALTVPKLKAYADEIGLSIEGNPNKAELISKISAFVAAGAQEAN